MDSTEIVFLPQRKVVKAKKGSYILDAAQSSFIDIESSCNGKGTCGKCLVQVMEGETEEPHADELRHIHEEDIKKRVRLACRTKSMSKTTFKVISSSEKRHCILSDSFLPEFTLDPPIRKRYITLEKPSLESNHDDLSRLLSALGDTHHKPSLRFLQTLPKVLRDANFQVTIIFHNDILIGIEPGDTTKACYGVAIDIGTTTIVASLMDMNTGKEIATSSMLNPQKSYGLDVLTRIQHIRENPHGLEILNRLVRESLDSLIGEVAMQAGIERDYIYEITLAANSTMMHIFLGIDPTGMGKSPYVPAFTSSMSIPANSVGISISDFGLISTLPSVSSYVGSDIVAGLISTEMFKSGKNTLFIDIGTNGEIALWSEKGLFACSCAAGPALEGMNISAGMRAADGAIEKVFIDNEVTLRTINDKPPAGICGSGIIDAVAEFLKVGALSGTGRFMMPNHSDSPPMWNEHLRNTDGKLRFVLSQPTRKKNEIAVTQKDIRQVQLAKGAILSGILVLTRQLEIDLKEIKEVYLAGAFGHHVRMESLARLGILPEELLNSVKLIGNSSKAGAILCLLSREKKKEAENIATRVKYIELSCYPDYDRLFTKSLSFPNTAIYG